ncbi:hypothetical protein LCGC14_1221000 [marine sediment metagenome]|uniref:Uncharacterized protein n=1 Tax=marine sediment metagenome TaxID=412755 RepID=A0A0F9LYF2_9ZZZZ
MLLKAMVATSTFGDLIDDISPHELNKAALTLNDDGANIPLVTASVSPARFAEFVKWSCAEIARDEDHFPTFEHAIFITAYSKTPECEGDCSTGLLGIWQRQGMGVV